MTSALPHWVCLGLGANLGDRRANLERALQRLSEAIAIEAISSLYETEPVGYAEQSPFLNAALRGHTALRPEELLLAAKEIEREAGRIPSFRNAPRPLDIDILLFGLDGGLFVQRTQDLVIPHPRLQERAFVLIPLAEIAGEVLHPVLGQTVAALRKEVGDRGVRLYARWGPLASDR